ncbi:MAG: PEP-CTERM sorting domain-containing protein [Tepidisphaeraceae bacterium]|jgi:hypothetical protein
MRRCFIALLPAVFLMLANSAYAVVGNFVNFDEQGNGTLVFGGQIVGVLQGFMSVDPTTNMTTLTYPIQAIMGSPVSAGDVLITEPPSNSAYSDLLRFDTNGNLYVYSDLDPGETPPPPTTISADQGLPPLSGPPTNPFANPYNNVAGPFAETGLPGQPYSDDANGLFGYIPGAGAPGFIINGPPVIYNFTSDVPEPCTLGVLAVGSLGLMIRRRRAA